MTNGCVFTKNDAPRQPGLYTKHSQQCHSGLFLAESVFALGDINLDGYDDFAVNYSRETTDMHDAGLLVYYGSPDFGNTREPNVLFRADFNSRDFDGASNAADVWIPANADPQEGVADGLWHEVSPAQSDGDSHLWFGTDGYG